MEPKKRSGHKTIRDMLTDEHFIAAADMHDTGASYRDISYRMEHDPSIQIEGMAASGDRKQRLAPRRKDPNDAKVRTGLPSIGELESWWTHYTDQRFVTIQTCTLDTEGKGLAPVDKEWMKCFRGTKYKWSSEHNIAVITGQRSGIICIDLNIAPDTNYISGYDVFNSIRNKYGSAEPCIFQQKPSGGYHYIFLYNNKLDGFESAERVIRCGDKTVCINIKSNGSYIVVEPSANRKSGQRYVWNVKPTCDNIRAVPDWLCRLMACKAVTSHDNNGHIEYDIADGDRSMLPSITQNIFINSGIIQTNSNNQNDAGNIVALFASHYSEEARRKMHTIESRYDRRIKKARQQGCNTAKLEKQMSRDMNDARYVRLNKAHADYTAWYAEHGYKGPALGKIRFSTQFGKHVKEDKDSSNRKYYDMYDFIGPLGSDNDDSADVGIDATDELVPAFNYSDPFVFGDFEVLVARPIHNSLDELIRATCKDITRVLAIIDGDRFLMKKRIDTLPTLVEIHGACPLTTYRYHDSDTVKELTFVQLVAKIGARFRPYTHHECRPPGFVSDDPKEFVVWPGFKSNLLDF